MFLITFFLVALIYTHNQLQVLSIPVLLLIYSQDCTWLWLTESEQATAVDSIKDIVRSSV